MSENLNDNLRTVNDELVELVHYIVIVNNVIDRSMNINETNFKMEFLKQALQFLSNESFPSIVSV